LGPLERPALLWLAARMPAWVTPDMLTGLGLFASILIFVSYCLTNLDRNFLWLASFGFILNWFGDSLDGNLARFRKIERPRYGYFVDHIVDAVSEVLIFLGLGLSPYVRFDLASLTLISYLLLSVLVYITTYVNNVFRVSYVRLGPTEMRVIAILANLVVYFLGTPSFQLPGGLGTFTFYNAVAVVISTLLFAIFCVVAIRQAMELNKLDRAKNTMHVKRPAKQARTRRARRSIARSLPATDD